MKQVKLKYEILISGLYPFDGDYEKDGYVMKRNKVTKEKMENYANEEIIYMSPLLGFCTYNLNGDIVYLTFEKEKVIELDIPDYKNIPIINEKLEELNLFEEAEVLEKMLVLELNNSIKFPIKMIKVYDMEDNFVTFNSNFTKLNIPSLLSTDKEVVLEKIKRQNYRLSSGFAYNKLLELQHNNPLFDRALSLYYSSFSVCDEKVGFILLITALETLLSLSTYSKVVKCKTCSQDVYKISDTISTNVNLLLMGNEEELKKDMKTKYVKRSKYLHGEIVEISTNDEQELQEYVRKVLLMYWYISLNKSTCDHKTIVDEFKSKEYKDNIIYKNFLTSLKNQSYNETQKDIFKEILDLFKK